MNAIATIMNCGTNFQTPDPNTYYKISKTIQT